MATAISSSFSTVRLPHLQPSQETPPPPVSSVIFRGHHQRSTLPDFHGLKFQQRPPNQSLSSFNSRYLRVSRRGGISIACEAFSDTTVDVPSVNDENWESLVVKADGPVMVEFWAPWCGPCVMIHPLVGELSKQYVGRLKCYKLNTDENPSIATQYGIRNIPTVMIFVNGEKKDAVIGAVLKTTLTNYIEKFL